jgi:hypothetical protein
MAGFSYLTRCWPRADGGKGFGKDAACGICSNKMILFGPAVWGDYFFEDCLQGLFAHNAISSRALHLFYRACKERFRKASAASYFGM